METEEIASIVFLIACGIFICYSCIKKIDVFTAAGYEHTQNGDQDS